MVGPGLAGGAAQVFEAFGIERGGVLLRTEVSGSCFPSEYYGIGPDTPKSEKEKYTSLP